MWCIARIDGKEKFFGLQWAGRKKDLEVDRVWASGFVGPKDRLVLLGPNGKAREELKRPE